MGKAAKGIAVDAATKVLWEALDGAVSVYEKKSGNKMDPKLLSVLKEFIKLHTSLLIDVAVGKLQMKHAVAALTRVADGLGLALDSKGIECGVAIFEVGVTGVEWTRTTMKVSRAASLAAATGIGAPAATATTVAVALFGVFMTTKDALDAADKCNEALSRKAAEEKRPPAVVDNRGFNLGQITTGFSSKPNYGMEMMCKAPPKTVLP